MGIFFPSVSKYDSPLLLLNSTYKIETSLSQEIKEEVIETVFAEVFQLKKGATRVNGVKEWLGQGKERGKVCVCVCVYNRV